MAASSYTYTTSPASLRKLLERLPSLGTPEKITIKWLEGLGFTSKNDRSLIPPLKAVGLLNSSGVPTDLWPKLRSGDKAAFAQAIRSAYAALFSLYPDAQRKDVEALTNFFRAHTDLAESAQRKCVQTFQALAEFADFDAKPGLPVAPEPNASQSALTPPTKPAVPRTASVPERAGGLTLNVNIQLQLPANADGETYDKLFEAMGKHLKELMSAG